MRRIAVDEVQAGDLLAEPLENDQGKMLLPKGAKLSSAVISRLRGWGIKSLAVEGDDPDFASTDNLIEALEIRFSDLEEDELMMRIKTVARSHLLKK